MRRFVKDYALTAKPLSYLLRMKSNKKDDRNFTLTEQGLLSFNLLKQLLVSAPVLKLFVPIATTEVWPWRRFNAERLGGSAVSSCRVHEQEDKRL